MMQIIDISLFVLIFILVTILFILSNREIKKSLLQTQASEKALAQERIFLIDKVHQQNKEIQKAKIERMNELAKIAEFGRLSQGLFHDLLTPLSSVVLHTEELKNIPHDQVEAFHTRLSKAVDASRRMTGYIRTIRSAMHGEHEVKTFNLHNELQNTIEIFSFPARKAGAAIILETPEKEITFKGDLVKIRQIFSNLISNALDSFDKKESGDRSVKVSLKKKKNSVIFSVSDNGNGISPTHLEKIFDSFFTTKSLEKGTGIGLSTVKSIVEKDLKGSIEVKSIEGKGSTFTISFPLQN